MTTNNIADMKNTSISGILLCALLVAAGAGCQKKVRHSPGVLLPQDPVQEAVSANTVFTLDQFTIRPLARFQVEARLLSKARYRHGREAMLAPVDFALGWGPMSDQAILDEINISQGGRFYFWKTKTFPISRRDISRHSSNMHMIPANDEVRETLLSADEGELVYFDGFLVVATTEDGWRWKSSLTRNDTGNGACELVWVDRILVHEDAEALPSFEWWRMAD